MEVGGHSGVRRSQLGREVTVGAGDHGGGGWWEFTLVGCHSGGGRSRRWEVTMVRSGAGWIWEGTSWRQESQQLKFMMEGGHGCWSIYL